MPDEFAELREALVKFNQVVKCPPQKPNIVFGIIRETEKLLAAYDRVVRERDNYKISIDELAASMTQNISVLEHKWYPKEDALIRWRKFGEFVDDYCRRMNFEVTGETRGDQIYSTVTDLLKENNE